jgi:hypothetical protein
MIVVILNILYYHSNQIELLRLCGFKWAAVKTHIICGIMWAAAEAHLIFVGYVDVGRVTRSRPTCIVSRRSQQPELSSFCFYSCPRGMGMALSYPPRFQDVRRAAVVQGICVALAWQT